ncbi:MAG: PQQ-dependent sugar dehydrogenase [Hyphomicrobiaceae bacterium]
MRLIRMCVSGAVAAVMSMTASVSADVKIKLQEFAAGLTHPLAMVSIPDGSGRLAVIEQHGPVRIINKDGKLLPDAFIDVGPKMVVQHHFFDERGLLGIAFHPNYKDNGKFYIAYSVPLRGRELDRRLWWSHTNLVSEFQVSKTDPNKADPMSERVISQLDWPQFNHDGHWIGFGPDGMLYISTGDGGYANDWGIGHNVTLGNGQDRMAPYGKMLRLDVNKPDLIPADNPFVGQANTLPQIWALGLRNPWRCSFDMGGDRALYCGDVQQNSFEEISVITKGANLGWRRMEGDKCFDLFNPDKHPPTCDQTGLTLPIVVYKNCTAIPKDCQGISVTGGYVYRGPHTAWQGKYIFGDWSKSFGEMDGQLFIATKGGDGKWTMEKAVVDGTAKLPYILAFAQDDKGEVYALTSISTGPVGGHDKIYKIVPAN